MLQQPSKPDLPPAGENSWREMADAIPHLAWMADGDGWIYWYNQRWYDYTGTTLDEMRGWGWQRVHHPDHVQRVVNFVRLAWPAGEPFELTFPLRARDGSYRWFLTRAQPVSDEAGRVVRWLGTNTDVTEQLQAEADRERLLAELAGANATLEERARERASELDRVARLHSLVLGAVGEGVFGMDAHGVTTFVNAAAAELTGWPPEEMIGRVQHDTVHHHYPDGRPFPKEECPLYQSLRTGVPLQGEDAVFYRKDGSTFPVAYSSRPIRDPHGELIGAVVTFRDISEQLRAREELERRQQQLEARNAEQEAFLYTVSHDLRQPLLSLQGMTDLLDETVLPLEAGEEAAFLAQVVADRVEEGFLLGVARLELL
ncbi:MAG TPA: PAS domain S-box protein, partial [Deinococcales bacterium]|nr:PAS domain S-box protein [Deinococcales bacterium]